MRCRRCLRRATTRSVHGVDATPRCISRVCSGCCSAASAELSIPWRQPVASSRTGGTCRATRPARRFRSMAISKRSGCYRRLTAPTSCPSRTTRRYSLSATDWLWRTSTWRFTVRAGSRCTAHSKARRRFRKGSRFCSSTPTLHFRRCLILTPRTGRCRISGSSRTAPFGRCSAGSARRLPSSTRG